MSTTGATTKRTRKEALGPYGRVGQVVGELDDRLGVAKGGRVFLDKIFPDHWSFMLGEISLYSFVVLLATGVFLSLYFVPSTQQVIYHGSYKPLNGQWVSEAYRSTVEHLLRRAGRPADPPDAPLGGRHLHRVDHRAHGPHLLHRSLPQAPRAELDHRHHHADPGHPGGLHRLLAPRRPHFGHRPAHRLLHRRVDPLRRQLPGDLPLGRPVPGDRHHNSALLHHPCLDISVGPDRPALGAPRLLVRQKHTQFKGEGRTENNVVGSPMFPTFMAKTTGFLFMVRRRPHCSAPSPRSTRSGSSAPTTRPRSPMRSSPTGTWAGSTAPCASCRPGSSPSGAHDPARGLPAGRGVPGHRVQHRHVWPKIEPGTRATPAMHNLLDRPATDPSARPSAWPSSPCCSRCSPPARPTSWPTTSIFR